MGLVSRRGWARVRRDRDDDLEAPGSRTPFFALGITGTVRYMVFFVIEIKSRAVEIAGIAVDPGEAWIHDRAPLFSKAFIAVLKAGGVKSVKIPAQSPNCNPDAERFVKTRVASMVSHTRPNVRQSVDFILRW